MRIGYARVSTEDQNLDRQIDALTKAGCERIYQEKVTGKAKHRPELDKMLEALRAGDQVVVVKLDRIGRNTKHLIELSETFESMGVDFISLGDSIDTSTATGKMMFTVLAAIAQFEADLNRERTMEGLASARARGRVGGRPKTDPKKIDQAVKMYDSNSFSISEITNVTGISKMTLYRYLSDRAKEGIAELEEFKEKKLAELEEVKERNARRQQEIEEIEQRTEELKQKIEQSKKDARGKSRKG